MEDKNRTHSRLFIGQSFGVFELSGQGELDFGQLGHLRFGFLQLTDQVGIFDEKFLLGRVEVVEGTIRFLQLALRFTQLLLDLFQDLLGGSLNQSILHKFGKTFASTEAEFRISVATQKFTEGLE